MVGHATGRRRIYGVDFSGAQDAGENVWLASATRLDDVLFVEGCFPAESLPGSGRDREACMQALRAFLVRADDAVVGVDFPFGLPAELVDVDHWTEFVRSFPDGAEDPETWAERCRSRAEALDGELVERKRATDETTGAPFSPYNLRMRSATYYGIADVLAPLVERDAVSVLPMQPPNPGRPWLVESCPAVTLDRLGVETTGYKDGGEDARTRRGEILDAVTADLIGEDDELAAQRSQRPPGGGSSDAPSVVMPPSVRETAIETADGDALDAIVAALGVALALERGDAFSPGTVDARTRLEGRIYG